MKVNGKLTRKIKKKQQVNLALQTYLQGNIAQIIQQNGCNFAENSDLNFTFKKNVGAMHFIYYINRSMSHESNSIYLGY